MKQRMTVKIYIRIIRKLTWYGLKIHRNESQNSANIATAMWLIFF